MAEGIDAASFEFYEGIRILIPGALTVGLAEGAARTLHADHSGLQLGTFNSFVAALLIGLVFYFVDAPAKAAVFVPLRPTDTLFSWRDARPRKGATTVNTYFVMLDEYIPGPIRARALYMGSMYRVGFEAIYLLILASTAILTIGVWSTETLVLDATDHPQEVWVAGAVMVAIWGYSLYLDGAERNKEKKATDIRSMHFWPRDLILILVILALNILIYVFHDRFASWVLIVPIAVLVALWATRHFRGYAEPDESATATTRAPATTPAHDPQPTVRVADRVRPQAAVPAKLDAEVQAEAGEEGPAESARPSAGDAPQTNDTPGTSDGPSKKASKKSKRRPIAATHACLLLLAVQLSVLTVVAALPWSSVGLSRDELRVWLFCAIAAMVMVCARGHEKRLRGAYATQNTWLTLHKEAVVERYFTPVEEQSGDGATDGTSSSPEPMPGQHDWADPV